MKKTLIALAALAGVAVAENAPVEYDAYILQLNNTGNKITELKSTRGQIWFNEDGASLTSWMLEFSLDKLNGGNRPRKMSKSLSYGVGGLYSFSIEMTALSLL